MIDHDRALELAASALDFAVADDDRALLQEHLDGCASCRAFDERMRGDARAIGDLAKADAPDSLRSGIVLASTMPPPPDLADEASVPIDHPAGAPDPRRRYRVRMAVLATAAVVVALVGGTLFWQSAMTPSSGVAVASPSPSSASPSDAPGSPRPSDQPDSGPVDGTWTAVADLTADDIQDGVVALASGFRLASLDGTPAADLAARIRVDPPIRFAVTPEGDGRTARITPNEPLTAGTLYRFTLTGTNGRTLDSWAFQAHQPLQVASTLPRDTTTDVPTDTGIEITFDQDGVVDAKSHFSIVPKIAGRFEQHGRTLAFVPAKRLAAHTIYTVTISRGVEVGKTGESLEADVRFRFETAGGPRSRIAYQFTNDLADAAPADRPTLALWISPERIGSGRQPRPPKSVSITVHRLADLDAAVNAYRQVREFPHWARGATASLVSTKGLPRVAAFDATLRTAEYEDFSWFQLPDRLPAGWYLVSLPSPTQTIQTILQVTDVAGYLAVSTTKTIVWVNDLASGSPLNGASVTIDGVDAGRTRDDGTLEATTPSSLTAEESTPCADSCSPVVTVRSGGRAMFMPAENLQPSFFDSEPDRATGESRYWSAFDTDRTMYRRTDTVQAWGVVRARPSRDVPATVVVELFSALDRDAAQAPLSTTEVHPDRVGAYSTSIALDDLPEGGYYVTSSVGDEIVGTTWIEIARILKPAYQLEVSTGRRVYFVGDRIKITATATFFEGSPAPGIPLRLDGVVDRSFKTDTTGTATLEATVRSDGENAYGGADIRYVRVSPARAEEGEISGASREIVVYPSTWVVDASAVVDAGEARVTGSLHAVDRDRLEREITGGRDIWELEPAGSPIAERTLTATFTELIPYETQVGTRYDFIEKKVVPVYESGTYQQFAGSIDVTTRADGTFEGSIPASANGHLYEVQLLATDPDGHAARWQGWATAPGTESSSDDGVLLPTSRPDDDLRYGIGDTVDLTMRGRASGRYLFYTAQQGIRDVVVQASPRFQTTFADWAAPGFNVTGVRFTGSGYVESQQYVAQFRQTDRELSVELSADAARYGPGADVRLTVTTRDQSGRPVPASVVLRAVDKKLFAIGGAQAAEPLAELYAEVGAGIITTYRSHREPQHRSEGGDTGGGGGDGLPRNDFRDAVLFKQVTTDASGSANVTFRVSDDLTSWRVSASAFGDGLTAGEASIDLPVGLPFFVDATIAPEYLASDHPVIGLRAFGTALDASATVTFTVQSDDLDMDVKGLRAKAFETASVPLPKLTPGTHSVTITARTGSGAREQRDVMTRTFTVVASRLARIRTAYLEPTAGAHPNGGDGRVDVVVSDAGAARYIPLLLGFAGADSGRLEPTLAASVAGSLLKDRLKVATTAASAFDAPTYQGDDGGLAILPYASSSVAVSALVALVAPHRVDPDRLEAYLWEVAGRAKATRETRNYALAGLAGLHAPVLPSLRAAIADQAITVRERLMLGLGAAALGDAATARAVAAALESQYGEVTGELARLRVGKTAADITDATALMAMLAAATGDPLAARLWASVEADPGVENTYDLHAVGFVIRLLERRALGRASFAYTIAGTRTVVDLEAGGAFHISLNHKEFESLTIETISGQVGVATSWSEAVKPSAYALDPDITISRRIAPTGRIGPADLVTVDLLVHLGPKAPKGCHLVTDLVPSGLVTVGSLESWVEYNYEGGRERNVTYPLAQVGQRVTFCAEKRPRTGDVHLRYYARVVTAGTYTWEPAVADSRSREGRAAITKAAVVTIR